MTIEKQINILLADRIKMLELDIKNPPQSLLNDIEEEPVVEEEAPAALSFNKTPKKQNKPAQPKPAVKPKKESKTEKHDSFDDDMDDIPVPMMTQDVIDKKFNEIKKENPQPVTAVKNDEEDTSVKLLDIALEKGTLDKGTVQHEKEKRRIRFFRDNFPGGEY
jgi:hypothetical protein